MTDPDKDGEETKQNQDSGPERRDRENHCHGGGIRYIKESSDSNSIEEKEGGQNKKQNIEEYAAWV
jgi:hypothetical protein